jgi:glycosyltransferase involved in cell wall biosynthesis
VNTPDAKPLTVLMVGNFLSSWLGTRSVCEDLAEKLRTAGFQVITTSARKSRVARMIDILGTIWTNRKRFQVAQIDVYSGPAFFWAQAACWLIRQLGKPYILSLHGGNLPEFSGRSSGRVARLLRSAAAVTSPSPYLRERMNSYCDAIQLLPNPLNLADHPFAPRAEVRPRLVWVRAFHEIYNPCLAAEVVSLLQKEFPEVSLTMIGPDKDQTTLRDFRERIEALGIKDRVEILGPVDKTRISEKLNENDIFLNTANIDNTPMSVLEAMACGLCVVSTNVGGIPYLLSHEQNAMLVPSANPQAMADAVRKVLLDSRLASRLSQNAFATSQKSDYNSVLPIWGKLLHGVFESSAEKPRRGNQVVAT